jgi:prepilin-type N-terminal cleavage/methylation domain-containing protein
MNKLKREKGFTLIEILIVVAIIGMLSSVVLVGLGSFRSRGRDARRAADLREIQNALELYYAKFGNYPNPYSNVDVSTIGLQGASIGVTKIPADPSSGQTYKYGSNGQSYVLGAKLEETAAAVLNDDIDNDVAERFGVDCADPVYCIKF